MFPVLVRECAAPRHGVRAEGTDGGIPQDCICEAGDGVGVGGTYCGTGSHRWQAVADRDAGLVMSNPG